MARSLSKVTKKISKKRGGRLNTLHENGRDSQRLRRAGLREEKVAKLMAAARSANQVYVDRVDWFREVISESENKDQDISDADLEGLVSDFIHRTDGNLEELQAQQRPGRPPSTLEVKIRNLQEMEEKEFKAGFWTPDVRQKIGRDKLDKWSGDWAGLNSLLFVRVVKDGEIKESKFPPKSLS